LNRFDSIQPSETLEGTSVERSIRRSGVSAERRILQKNELSGFLPKAAA